MLAVAGNISDELVSIVEKDANAGITMANAGKYDQFPVEDVMSEDNLRHECQLLYPPQKKFIETYNLWLKHQSCFWSVHENDPSIDHDKFLNTTPKQFQEILLKTVGCIAVGDSIVLDRIAGGLMEKITSIELKAMFTDQEAREFIHKKMYNNMLDIASNSDYYRSDAFKNEYMSVLEELAEKYCVDDIRIQMYFIMMCEIILFAPMFQTICYAATKGYCPKLCDLNLLVMRDEHIHYENARLQLSKFKTKLNCAFANEVLHEFKEITINLYRKIIGDYDDGVFNIGHVEAHFNHVIEGFIYENGLREITKDFKIADTPAKFYMNLPSCELKINRMEANSTIYTVPGDTTPLVRPKRRHLTRNSIDAVVKKSNENVVVEKRQRTLSASNDQKAYNEYEEIRKSIENYTNGNDNGNGDDDEKLNAELVKCLDNVKRSTDDDITKEIAECLGDFEKCVDNETNINKEMAQCLMTLKKCTNANDRINEEMSKCAKLDEEIRNCLADFERIGEDIEMLENGRSSNGKTKKDDSVDVDGDLDDDVFEFDDGGRKMKKSQCQRRSTRRRRHVSSVYSSESERDDDTIVGLNDNIDEIRCNETMPNDENTES